MNYTEIIDFWFNEIEPTYWWKKDTQFDSLLTSRFQAIHTSAKQCELYVWRKNPLGRLAEIIILDQFSRNIYRDNALSFANDSLALVLAQEVINTNAHQVLSPVQKSFLYMPFMHSESSKIHEIAVGLFSEPEMGSKLDFELQHKSIIDRFGRYPHRNKTLERASTDKEIEFLRQPNSSF